MYYLPQKKLTTLSTPGGITTAAQTTGIKIADVTGIDITKAGIICINWAQPLDETKFEYITYTSIDATNVLQGVTRGAEGSTARSEHTNGAVIAYIVSKSHINDINAAFEIAFDSAFRLKTENTYAADAGATDAYAITLSPAPTAYTTGMIVNFKANTANTGACTLDCNSLGAKTIKKNYNSDLDTGDISANQLCSVMYDGTNFQMLSGAFSISSSSTSTLTNKRIGPRIVSASSYTTDTGTSLSVATCDEFLVTAQAGALKFNNPGGTPVEGQKLIIRIKDNGTARALTYGTEFRAMGTALPSTTVLSKTLYLGFIRNATDTKWDLVAAAQEL